MTDDIKQLNDKIDYLTKLIETLLEERKTGGKKRQMDVMKLLNSSVFAQNPAFKRVVDSMKDSLKGT